MPEGVWRAGSINEVNDSKMRVVLLLFRDSEVKTNDSSLSFIDR